MKPGEGVQVLDQIEIHALMQAQLTTFESRRFLQGADRRVADQSNTIRAFKEHHRGIAISDDDLSDRTAECSGFTTDEAGFTASLHVDQKEFQNPCATAPRLLHISSGKFDHALTDASRPSNLLLNQPPPLGGGDAIPSLRLSSRRVEAQ
jgi:hypothetical protein